MLTATDSSGLKGTTSVRVDPKTVTLSFATVPTGLQLAVGSTSSVTPFTRTVIQGSRNTISATTPQTLGGSTYTWQSWSDAGLQSHDVIANAAATYTATYQVATGSPSYTATVIADGPSAYWRLGEASGTVAADQQGSSPGTYTGSYALGKAGCAVGRHQHVDHRRPERRATSRVPDSAKVDFGDGPFTIEFWAKRAGTGSGYVINKGTGGYGVFFSGSDQKLHFEKVNTQVTAQESGTTDQAWHHWVIVQGAGSTNAIIYKDGVNVTRPQQHDDVPRHDGAARDRPQLGIDAVQRRPRRGRALQQGPDRRAGRGPLRRPQRGPVGEPDEPLRFGVVHASLSQRSVQSGA